MAYNMDALKPHSPRKRKNGAFRNEEELEFRISLFEFLSKKAPCPTKKEKSGFSSVFCFLTLNF
jgi:hypothetical protein